MEFQDEEKKEEMLGCPEEESSAVAEGVTRLFPGESEEPAGEVSSEAVAVGGEGGSEPAGEVSSEAVAVGGEGGSEPAGEEPSEDVVEEGSASGKEERLAKFLASAGIASRRNCEELILEGRVTVNGEPVVSPAYNVDPEKDQVCFEGRLVESHPQGKVYLLLNKPVGFTCSAKDAHAERLVFDLIPQRFGRLFTVGRLDRDSEGLLMLTNDGDYAQQVMHPSRQILKRYYVECDGQFTTSLRRRMLEGFYDNDEFLRALAVEEKGVQKGHCALEITLGEGRKREVRRLCKDVGLEVTLLRRVAIGGLELDEKLAPGAWRMMSGEEQEKVFQRIQLPEQPISADPRPYWQKERKPFDREHRPYSASPYPEYKKEAAGPRKPFDRDRKPFDRDRKPFDRERRPWHSEEGGEESGERRFERRPFDRDRKPFDRDRKPFDRERKPFDRDRKPFDRDRKPFDRERRPWYTEEGGEESGERRFERRSFDRERKPFDRDRKPFDRDRKPFDRDRKPFDRDRKPFGHGGEGRGERRNFRSGRPPRSWR